VALLAIAAVAVGAVFAWALLPDVDRVTDGDVREAALQWVDAGRVQEVRGDGEEWEVDVVRPDGSLVEVTIGERLELLQLDEERGAHGRPTPDMLSGEAAGQAGDAALRATSGGHVLGSEREPDGDLEVDVRLRDGTLLEVGLTPDLVVHEVARETPGDE
jgi:hypothetical protein